MHISRARRRWLAVVVALLLIACQGVGAAGARLAAALQADIAVAPCHSPTGKADSHDALEVYCRCDPASSTAHGFTVPSAADLPVMLVASAWRQVGAGPSEPRALSASEYIEPPPLPILHCRLRN
jgi:hypothetical protein